MKMANHYFKKKVGTHFDEMRLHLHIYFDGLWSIIVIHPLSRLNQPLFATGFAKTYF